MQWDDLTDFREERTNVEIYSRAQAEVNLFPAKFRVCTRTAAQKWRRRVRFRSCLTEYVTEAVPIREGRLGAGSVSLPYL